jgi:amino acid transporter
MQPDNQQSLTPQQPVSQDPVQPNTQQPKESGTLNTLGILSIVCLCTGLLPIGFIFGLVGDIIARREHRPVKFFRIGWILNISFLALVLLILWGLHGGGNPFASNSQHKRDDQRQADVDHDATLAENYYNEHGYYPASFQELPNAILTDEQGNPYAYIAYPDGCKNNCTSFKINAGLELAHVQYTKKSIHN